MKKIHIKKWEDLDGLKSFNFKLEVATKDKKTLMRKGGLKSSYKKNGDEFPYVEMIRIGEGEVIFENNHIIPLSKMIIILNDLGFNLEFKPEFDLFNFLRKNLVPTEPFLSDKCVYLKVVGNRVQPCCYDGCKILGAQYFEIVGSNLDYYKMFEILKSLEDDGSYDTNDIIQKFKKEINL